MSHETLFKLIRPKKHIISVNDLIGETYIDYLDLKLNGVLLCDYGGLRSRDASEGADRLYNLPFVFLMGGLMGLTNLIEIPKKFDRAIDSLNEAPMVGVILTPVESYRYQRQILSRLRNVEYFDREDYFYAYLAKK